MIEKEKARENMFIDQEFKDWIYRAITNLQKELSKINQIQDKFRSTLTTLNWGNCLNSNSDIFPGLNYDEWPDWIKFFYDDDEYAEAWIKEIYSYASMTERLIIIRECSKCLGSVPNILHDLIFQKGSRIEKIALIRNDKLSYDRKKEILEGKDTFLKAVLYEKSDLWDTRSSEDGDPFKIVNEFRHASQIERLAIVRTTHYVLDTFMVCLYQVDEESLGKYCSNDHPFPFKEILYLKDIPQSEKELLIATYLSKRSSSKETFMSCGSLWNAALHWRKKHPDSSLPDLTIRSCGVLVEDAKKTYDLLTNDAELRASIFFSPLVFADNFYKSCGLTDSDSLIRKRAAMSIENFSQNELSKLLSEGDRDILEGLDYNQYLPSQEKERIKSRLEEIATRSKKIDGQ